METSDDATLMLTVNDFDPDTDCPTLGSTWLRYGDAGYWQVT